MTKRIARMTILFVFSLGLLVGCSGEKKADTAGTTKAKVETKKPASKAHSGEIIDLTNFDLHEFDGKVRMYELWGVWCRPCIMSMPKVQALWEKYQDVDDFELLVINTAWRGDNLARVNDWLAKNPQYDFPVYFDPTHSVPTQYGVNSIPRTIVIGKDNKVRFNDHPMRIPEGLLDELLAE